MILRRKEYDKVVVENSIPTFIALKGLGKKYNGKYDLHLHNVPRTSASCKKIIQGCNAILCVSNFVREKILSSDNAIGPISPDKAKVLYNCIDIKKFSPKSTNDPLILQFQNKFEVSKGERIILFAGRLSSEKGADKLLEAVQGLEMSNIVVMIVGSYHYGDDEKDEYSYKLMKLAKMQNIRIVFTGYIKNNELPYIYNLADVAVFPSVWDEPAGLTMIEAMACGVPVITTMSGGIPEYVGEYAVVIERDENLVKNITFNLNKLLCDEKLRKKMSREGVIHINDKFSSKSYLESFMAKI